MTILPTWRWTTLLLSPRLSAIRAGMREHLRGKDVVLPSSLSAIEVGDVVDGIVLIAGHLLVDADEAKPPVGAGLLYSDPPAAPRTDDRLRLWLTDAGGVWPSLLVDLRDALFDLALQRKVLPSPDPLWDVARRLTDCPTSARNFLEGACAAQRDGRDRAAGGSAQALLGLLAERDRTLQIQALLWAAGERESALMVTPAFTEDQVRDRLVKAGLLRNAAELDWRAPLRVLSPQEALRAAVLDAIEDLEPGVYSSWLYDLRTSMVSLGRPAARPRDGVEGRERAVQELLELLPLQDKVQVVVVEGAAGLGKSTLAALVAQEFEGEREAVYLSLHGDAAAAWAGLWAQITPARLRASARLLIVDDVEGVEGRALLDQLPMGRGRLAILVLSRAPQPDLRAAGAVLHRLKPLAARAARRLLNAVAGHDVGGERRVDSILARCAGVPARLIEAGLALSKNPAHVVDDLMAGGGLIEKALAALSEQDRAIVEYLALCPDGRAPMMLFFGAVREPLGLSTNVQVNLDWIASTEGDELVIDSEVVRVVLEGANREEIHSRYRPFVFLLARHLHVHGCSDLFVYWIGSQVLPWCEEGSLTDSEWDAVVNWVSVAARQAMSATLVTRLLSVIGSGGIVPVVPGFVIWLNCHNFVSIDDFRNLIEKSRVLPSWGERSSARIVFMADVIFSQRLISEGKGDEAAVVLEGLRGSETEDVDVWDRVAYHQVLGLLAASKGNDAGVIDSLDNAIVLAQGAPDIRFSRRLVTLSGLVIERGVAHFSLGHLEAARRDWDYALRLLNESGSAAPLGQVAQVKTYYALATARSEPLAGLEWALKAVSDAETAHERAGDPSSASIYAYALAALAACYDQLGQFESALSALRQAQQVPLQPAPLRQAAVTLIAEVQQQLIAKGVLSPSPEGAPAPPGPR
jgi:hypothetical protein